MLNSETTLSDQELRKRIYQAFAAEEQLRRCHLRVGVAGGFVHLAGKVSTLSLYTLAEKLAKSIAGVKGVINRIEAPGAPSPSRVIHLDDKNQTSPASSRSPRQSRPHKQKENKK